MILTGLKELGTEISKDQLEKLNFYVNLILRWNKVYNLTAIKDKSQIEIAHILDSASCNDFISGIEILDVGTGAGLPGVVLAVLNPDKNFTLLDSNNKKIRFLNQCQIELGLDNIKPIHSRIEGFAREHKFDTIVSRAFASFDAFADKCGDLLETGGILMAMKGKWDEKASYEVQAHKIKVPLLGAERHIVIHQA